MIWQRLFGKAENDNPGRSGKRVTHVHGDRAIEYTARGDAKQSEQDDPVGWRPVNPLEEQMAQIPHSTDAQFAFARMLLDSEVLLATARPPENARERTLDADEQFDILCFDDNQGGSAAGIFTSEARLADALGPETGFLALSGRAALEAVANTGAIINPGRGLWALYSPPTIERILSGDI